MPKHHHQNKPQQSNRGNTSVSIDPEAPPQMQEQMGSSQSTIDTGYVPSYEDIQRRAYQIHEVKGGSDLENWLEAERVLKEEYQER